MSTKEYRCPRCGNTDVRKISAIISEQTSVERKSDGTGLGEETTYQTDLARKLSSPEEPGPAAVCANDDETTLLENLGYNEMSRGE